MDIQKYLDLIGNNIRQTRVRSGVNQATLAKKAGVSRSTIQSAERGKSIALEHILRIAIALKIDPADLFLTDEDRQITYKAKLFWESIFNLKK